MANPVVHFEIVGEGGEQLQPFYRELFGWQIDADNPYQYGMVDTGGEGINGGIGPSPGAPRVTIYVQVPDLQAALDHAQRLGGKTVMAPMEIPGGGMIAMFADPLGNVLGLIRR